MYPSTYSFKHSKTSSDHTYFLHTPICRHPETCSTPPITDWPAKLIFRYVPSDQVGSGRFLSPTAIKPPTCGVKGAWDTTGILVHAGRIAPPRGKCNTTCLTMISLPSALALFSNRLFGVIKKSKMLVF
ncbi:hypothetical protein IG631_17635 [Alternaria alternata]|nr:hypothetical protein IG631_17635 [Alternaria alternata]